MPKIYDGFDLSTFWKESDYARREYVGEPISDDLVASIEAELGRRLPASYLELMKTQNGGVPHNTCFPTTVPTSYAKGHVAITGILESGETKLILYVDVLAAYSCKDIGDIPILESAFALVRQRDTT